MNKYLELKGEIINLENIFQIIKNEKDRNISINYIIDGKIINYELDYSDIKDNVNEEKTILQKDFEILESELECKKEYIEFSKYKALEDNYNLLKEIKDNYLMKLQKILKILENENNKFKIVKLIKELF